MQGNHRRPVLALLWLALAIAPAWADQVVGRVFAIADGDTLTVLTADRIQHRVRPAGIDAPEKRQAFGQVAKEHLSGLVYGKTVTVDCSKRDRYGRIIGKVLVNGTDGGLRQVSTGMAWQDPWLAMAA